MHLTVFWIVSRTFAFNKDFDIDAYFRGCCGIIHSDEEPIKVVVKAYNNGADYLRTLPIHDTQRELMEVRTDEATYFELQVCPTYDLYQSLLLHADQIEVVEPESVRKQMRNFIQNLMSYYKD